jgi:hypothetical protein
LLGAFAASEARATTVHASLRRSIVQRVFEVNAQFDDGGNDVEKTFRVGADNTHEACAIVRQRISGMKSVKATKELLGNRRNLKLGDIEEHV